MIRLALRVRREDAEVVLAELLELAPGGVEEVEDGDVVEYAVYGAPGELPELPDLEAAAGGALVEVRTTEVADDWAERWRAFHRPVAVGGGRLVVRPPWEPAPAPGVLDLVMDPGQAFGTGGHDTTRLCLELLLDLPPAGSVLDVGCGSGVLAIAAAMLGWGPVHGTDHDILAVDATRENARVNGVEVTCERADLRRDPVGSADLVLANLLRPLLLELAPQLDPATSPAVIASGLLRAEGEEIAAAFAARGYALERRLDAGDWCALRLRTRSGEPRTP